MSQFTLPHRLKRMVAGVSVSPGYNLRKLPRSTSNINLRIVESGAVNRILRIFVGDLLDDYHYIRSLGKDTVAMRKASYFKLVNIRQCHSSDAFKRSHLLLKIQSPNIATIYDLYCNNGKVFIVTEHLEISYSELEVQKYDLVEWEIATIIMEVRSISLVKMFKPTITGHQGVSLYLLTKNLL